MNSLPKGGGEERQKSSFLGKWEDNKCIERRGRFVSEPESSQQLAVNKKPISVVVACLSLCLLGEEPNEQLSLTKSCVSLSGVDEQ